MDNAEYEIQLGRRYSIEDVFEDFSDYQRYLVKALGLFQDLEKKRHPSFKKYVPEFLEIEFESSIKAPRLYFPRYRGVIVVQIPSNHLSPRKRAFIREKALQTFVAIVKINELGVADEIAMRMKVIEKKTTYRKS